MASQSWAMDSKSLSRAVRNVKAFPVLSNSADAMGQLIAEQAS
jgi:hypothetical protein